MAAGWRRRVWTPRCWGVYATPCDECLPEAPVHRVVDPPRADAALWTKGFHAIERTQSLRKMSRLMALDLNSAYVAVRLTSRRPSRPPSTTTALYHALCLGGLVLSASRSKRRRRARVFSVAVPAVAGEGRCFAVVLALLSDVAPLSGSRRCSSWPSRAGAEAVVLLTNASARRRLLLAARAARCVRLEHVLAINANPCSTQRALAPL